MGSLADHLRNVTNHKKLLSQWCLIHQNTAQAFIDAVRECFSVFDWSQRSGSDKHNPQLSVTAWLKVNIAKTYPKRESSWLADGYGSLPHDARTKDRS
jgi:predicted NUDIX family NTP pyrophosphohydrolase